MSLHDLTPATGPDAAAVTRPDPAARLVPSASDVLASCSAARLVSTPPAAEPRAAAVATAPVPAAPAPGVRASAAGTDTAA